jgi:hypothetical protein
VLGAEGWAYLVVGHGVYLRHDGGVARGFVESERGRVLESAAAVGVRAGALELELEWRSSLGHLARIGDRRRCAPRLR